MKLLRCTGMSLVIVGICATAILGMAQHDLLRLGGDEIWNIPTSMPELRPEFPWLWLAVKLHGVDPFVESKATGSESQHTNWKKQFMRERQISGCIAGCGVLLCMVDWIISRHRKRSSDIRPTTMEIT